MARQTKPLSVKEIESAKHNQCGRLRPKKNLYVVVSTAAWEGTGLQVLQRQLAESA